MVADVAVLRAAREQDASQSARDKAEQNAQKLRRIAEDIRRMTRIYQERLEGRRDVVR